MTKKTAIIGAGLAGLSCARTLRRAGLDVEVFEQDAAIGGRIATIRVGSDAFDHGAQYVCAKSPEFNDFLSEIKDLGYAERWTPQKDGSANLSTPGPWMVGTPGMSSLVRPLTDRVRIDTGRRVHTLEWFGKGWHAWFADDTSAGPFDAVAVATPAAEARPLLGHIEEFADALARVRMAPCWAVMVHIDKQVFPKQDVFSNVSGIIGWVARNNTKPRRNPDEETIVVHATSAWSREAEDLDATAVAEELWDEVSRALRLPPVRPAHMTAHLWRQGFVDQPLGEAYLYSSAHKAGIAGDWCLGGLAEHAFESGDRLGRAIVGALV
ncbi:FAD dependent oxidoreductase [Hyphomicrobium denitrificans 1NES1]|uniref:FAD dependent oxidoreductase n=1 Tax=Hyphomicrobium denitrificans 1NES1 TaxID=670307 RepID=N0BGN2_9HYPH|nr:FAD-dependent oxidoreductase [Hyphomicrobium denitrificans]AGK59576.1 FAD dependent oxidoreductase [Hyphomicrobium denitrificans 1NES1]